MLMNICSRSIYGLYQRFIILTLDMELRMLQIVEEDNGDTESSYYIQEISRRNNFEFIQAMIRLFLKVRLRPFLYVMNIISTE